MKAPLCDVLADAAAALAYWSAEVRRHAIDRASFYCTTAGEPLSDGVVCWRRSAPLEEHPSGLGQWRPPLDPGDYCEGCAGRLRAHEAGRPARKQRGIALRRVLALGRTVAKGRSGA